MRLIDEWLKVEASLELSLPAIVWRFPIETVSLSESGFERLYQSSVIIPRWSARLEPRGEFSVRIHHRLGGRMEGAT